MGNSLVGVGVMVGDGDGDGVKLGVVVCVGDDVSVSVAVGVEVSVEAGSVVYVGSSTNGKLVVNSVAIVLSEEKVKEQPTNGMSKTRNSQGINLNQ
jgi:hypothetical protein